MGPIAIITAGVAACLLSLLVTPRVAVLARRLGAIDQPDGRRKRQKSAVATGGGIAVAIAAGAAVAAATALVPQASTSPINPLLTGLLPSALVLIAVGLIDDVVGLTGIYKLIGQVFAVSLLVAGGLQFDYISAFGVAFHLGSLSIPFTLFFCLGAINAFNLIDGIDGLVSVVGVVVFVTLGIIVAAQADFASAVICFALAGALVGFLRYNLPPAKIYLGDTGSMLIGLVVGAIAIHGTVKEQTAFALMVPIAICAIPILDAVAAVIRRLTTGQSVFTPDRGHLHHALLLRGWSIGNTVTFVAGLTCITCIGALASFFTDVEAFALLATMGVFAALAWARIFGHIELALISSHGKSLLRTTLNGVRHFESETERSVHVQGNRRWEKVWLALCEAAPTYNLAGLHFTINIPHLHEAFHASWKRSEKTKRDEAWQMTLPLRFQNISIGRLDVSGHSFGNEGVVEMQQFLEFAEGLEGELEQTIADASGLPDALTHTAGPAIPVLLSGQPAANETIDVS